MVNIASCFSRNFIKIINIIIIQDTFHIIFINFSFFNIRILNLISLFERQRIYIHGILGFALSEFEDNVYVSLGFRKIKELGERITVYELDEEKFNGLENPKIKEIDNNLAEFNCKKKYKNCFERPPLLFKNDKSLDFSKVML